MRLSDETTTEHLTHLPASLTYLTVLRSVIGPMHNSFDADIAETVRLPSDLRYLRLVSVPYRAFRNLPSSLEHLVVKDEQYVSHPIDFWGFDGPLRHAWLQTLELPDDYNHPISANHLPSLRELCLADGFNQPLDDLPASLRKLSLSGFEAKQPLDSLPADLTELDLSRSSYNHFLDHLPHRLRSLVLSSYFDQPLDALPSGLTRLEFGDASDYNQPLDNLPESLQVLILSVDFDQPLQQLPPSLRVLQFQPYCPFNHPLPPLPESLSILHLGNAFIQPLRRLPRGLTDLQLGSSFNHPLPLSKPEPALVLFAFDEDEKQESPFSSSTSSFAADVDSQESKAMTYPVALRSLKLGRGFDQPLLLPPSLTVLYIDPHGVFNQPLPISSLPEALTTLRLTNKYRLKLKAVDVAAVQKRCRFLNILDL